ncbi:MAG: hypothetical protein AAGD25_34145 [Cyanobacteria bacterium P01_F01_bin.150]
MAQRLKRWESPRKSGRNDKGKGGSARQRQRKKQFKLLEKRLKQRSQVKDQKSSKQNTNPKDGRDIVLSHLAFYSHSRFCRGAACPRKNGLTNVTMSINRHKVA